MSLSDRTVQTAVRFKITLSLVSGAVLPLAYSPFDQFWIAPLSYAVLFYLWRYTIKPGQAFRLAFVYGLASFLGGIYWIYISVHDFGQAPISLAVFLTLGLVITLAFFVGMAGWLAARWFGTDGPIAWFGTLPALWVLTEWCRGWILTGLGWLSAGYSQTDSWLMGYAPVVGLYGMSWAVMLSAGALVAVVAGTHRTRVRVVAVLVLLWGVAYALSAYRWTEPKQRLLSVALVQGAVTQDRKWLPEQLEATLELYRRLTLESAGNQLIIWPEAAIPLLYEHAGPYLDEVRRQAAQWSAVVMLGILRDHPETGARENALVALTDPPAVYVKRHLVPYGEYFPVPGYVRNWMRMMSLPNIDAAPGPDEQPPLELLGERIAVTICYEDVFGSEQLDYLPDASLLVNVSNDAWFGDSIAPHQHLQIARLRAAEVGRYLLRSTNTGVTAIIDPSGRVVAQLPQFEPGVLEGSVQGFTGLTPYARWGNYPVVLGAILVLLGIFVHRRRTR